MCIMCVCGLRGGVGVFWGQEVKYTIKHSMLSVCSLGRGQSRTLYQLCNNQIDFFHKHQREYVLHLCWSSTCYTSEELTHLKQATYKHNKCLLTCTDVVLTDVHLWLWVQNVPACSVMLKVLNPLQIFFLGFYGLCTH